MIIPATAIVNGDRSPAIRPEGDKIITRRCTIDEVRDARITRFGAESIVADGHRIRIAGLTHTIQICGCHRDIVVTRSRENVIDREPGQSGDCLDRTSITPVDVEGEGSPIALEARDLTR